MDTQSLDSVDSVESGVDIDVIRTRLQRKVSGLETGVLPDPTLPATPCRSWQELVLAWVEVEDGVVPADLVLETQTLFQNSMARASDLAYRLRSRLAGPDPPPGAKIIKLGQSMVAAGGRDLASRVEALLVRSRKIRAQLKTPEVAEIQALNQAFMTAKQTLADQVLGGRQDLAYREALAKARASWRQALGLIKPRLETASGLGPRSAAIVKGLVSGIDLELLEPGPRGKPVLDLTIQLQSRVKVVCDGLRRLTTRISIGGAGGGGAGTPDSLKTYQDLEAKLAKAKTLQTSLIMKLARAGPDLDSVESQLSIASKQVACLETQLHAMVPKLMPGSPGTAVGLREPLAACQNIRDQLQKIISQMKAKHKTYEDEVAKLGAKLKARCKEVTDRWTSAASDEVETTRSRLKALIKAYEAMVDRAQVDLEPHSRGLGMKLGHLFDANTSMTVTRVLLNGELTTT